MEASNPCMRCGGCCVGVRVSFYWAEADDAPGGTVPVDLTEPLPPFRRAMKGTNGSSPRCEALEGTAGNRVRCRIHARRSSTCRGFAASYQDGVTPSLRCDQARRAIGLAPLDPGAWTALRDRVDR
jgi:Fe-S-cluster containining protein